MYRIRRRAYFDSESSDEELQQPTSKTNELRKKLRVESNPFAMSENEFRGMFRLSRYAARELINEILAGNPDLDTMRNSNAIRFETRFLAVLNFFAHGSYQKPTAENRLFCQAQSTMSRSLHLVLDELLKLMGKYIRFPITPEEVSAAKVNFMAKFGMSGIVGAVDGTHIAIIQPPEKDNGHLYYNRKHFYSINAMSVCNANMEFIFVDAQYPGSVHDSAIWQMGKLKRLLKDDGSSFILGDSGFPSARCLLTPVINADAGSNEERYNDAHKHSRNVIERTFGVLKARFRCVLHHRVLHYSPATACRIVYACMILHNICIRNQIDLPEDVVYEDNNEDDEDNDGMRNEDNFNARKAYISRYYCKTLK